jgi:hypothetical protein
MIPVGSFRTQLQQRADFRTAHAPHAGGDGEGHNGPFPASSTAGDLESQPSVGKTSQRVTRSDSEDTLLCADLDVTNQSTWYFLNISPYYGTTEYVPSEEGASTRGAVAVNCRHLSNLYHVLALGDAERGPLGLVAVG